MEDIDKEPADLEIRIATKRGALFQKTLEEQEKAILQDEANAEISKVVRDYCLKQVKIEEAVLEEQKSEIK